MTTKLDRALALSCDRALTGLDPRREAELVSLLPPGQMPDVRLELAAAAIVLSDMVIDQQLPDHLANKILAAAANAPRGPAPITGGGTMLLPQQQPHARTELYMPQASVEQPRSVPPSSAASPSNVPSSNVVPLAKRRGSILPWLAAAACLAIAAGSIYAMRLPKPAIAVRISPNEALPDLSARPAPSEPSVAEKKQRLMSEAKDVVKVAWSPTKDAAGQGETGEVVWSNERQEGYMTFRTVAKNDPTKSQYQLWIFDGERDERYPVDGGVFDVDPSSGEVVVPISAKVKVAKPTLFAVTVEAPGGVVVSKRERIVVAAKVAG
ncbi:MAG: anti-sigma factor [Polyangiaceae bacterium]|nr:anti-sigma factor [Polyangiaceae bacterium]